MKKAIFVISVVLNIALIVLVAGLVRTSRNTAFRTMSDVATSEVRLQEHFLSELESGDLKRIEAAKTTMRRNIENGKKASETWACATK